MYRRRNLDMPIKSFFVKSLPFYFSKFDRSQTNNTKNTDYIFCELKLDIAQDFLFSNAKMYFLWIPVWPNAIWLYHDLEKKLCHLFVTTLMHRRDLSMILWVFLPLSVCENVYTYEVKNPQILTNLISLKFHMLKWSWRKIWTIKKSCFAWTAHTWRAKM